VKPYYEDSESGIAIYHGDCLDVLPTLGSDFDLVFTSPPYNLGSSPWPHLGHWRPGNSPGGGGKWPGGGDGSTGIVYENHADTMPWAEYVQWQRTTLEHCWSLLSDTGAIFYNHKPRSIGGRLWMPLELNPDLPLRQIIVWARSGGLNLTPTAYVPSHEWIMILAKPGWRLRDRGASGVGDVWRFNQESSTHPAPFPLGLPARAIETAGPKLVLDPFMGSGTTLRAAKDAGVRAVGIEKSERYCEMAAKRLSQGVLFPVAEAAL
jgi:modification methylase